ncbi:MAG: IPT/TIG domain-containing protein [Saprospiraceae bacterium]|nr:IPT/TIG domain-containing protein [Saprospiraceae bacterium]
MKIFFLFIPLFLVHNVHSQGPVLCFSDLISGPKTGNSDHSQENQTAGRDGSIVTIWGANLGNHQNNNEVFVGNQKARVYYWGNATFPADLYKVHKLQKIAFQIPETVDTGNTEISVIVNGIKSNSLPFRVREGKIYFVDKMGDDVAGDGSWDKPWKTLDNADYTGALEKIKPGDLLYVKDGFVHTELVGDRSCFDIGNPGTRELPKAIIAYPQANVQIGDTSTLKTFSLWVSGYGPSTNWVISGLKLTAKTEAVSMYHNFRVVGNYITAPNGNGPTGAVAGQGNDLYLLGNELTEIGNLNTSKLYHPIYIQSAEACSGPRLPLEKNRVIAFNYLHDNLSYDGINLYRECGSSAYMTDHKVFNNAIINQTGCGIRCGDYVVGENHIYNNLLVNCGLGPDPINGYAMHVPMHIHAGWDDTISLIHCYNNTIVGGDFGMDRNGLLQWLV